VRALVIAVLVLAAAPGAALAQFKPAPLSQPVYPESVVEEHRIATEDGTIYGWVRRPVVPDGVKVPVLLTYSPYAALYSRTPGEDKTAEPSPGDYYTPRGYARAFFHLVGTGNSGGCFDYGGPRDRRTAYAVVEYLGRAGWSNGRVGMLGYSYEGTTQWAAAVETPPHLTTIVPQASITRWYDYAFQHGVRLEGGWGTPAGFDFGFNFVPVPSKNPDPAAAQALADSVRQCDEAEHTQRAYGPDPVYDEFWRARDYLADADRVRASVFLETSWSETNVLAINTIQMWNRLPAGLPRMLRVGMQGHGPAEFETALEVRQAWLDRELLGMKNNLDLVPTVTSEFGPQGDGAAARLLTSDQWPPRGTEVERLPLGDAGGLAVAPGDSPVWTDNQPAHHEQQVVAPPPSGEGGEATAIFLGAPVKEATRVTGIPVLDAEIVTSEISTFVVPVLFDENAQGSRTIITRGALNSRNRRSEAESTELTPGERWRARVHFQPTDWVLAPGHRLGVGVMSMNVEHVLYPDTTRATNELVLGGASALEVPFAPMVEAPPAAGGTGTGSPLARDRPPVRPAGERPAGPLIGISGVRRSGRIVRVRVRCAASAPCRVTARLRRGKRSASRAVTSRVAVDRSRTLKLKVRGRARGLRLVVSARAGTRRAQMTLPVAR
jgi:X-Pro dipeptidyl-peptidase